MSKDKNIYKNYDETVFGDCDSSRDTFNYKDFLFSKKRLLKKKKGTTLRKNTFGHYLPDGKVKFTKCNCPYCTSSMKTRNQKNHDKYNLID